MTLTGNSIAICNARLFDPAQGISELGSLLIVDGIVEEINPKSLNNCRIIDVQGNYLFPGFCDPHVHFRTPGQTHKEDLHSGSKAALAGGYTTVVQMPNTEPPLDQPDLVRKLTRSSPIELRVIAAVTNGCRGENISDWKSLTNSGAVGLSDDGRPVFNNDFIIQALLFSQKTGIPIASHCEDFSYGVQGPVRSGIIAEKLKLDGWDPHREWEMVRRHAAYASETGGHLHVCHVSTSQSVEIIRQAKRDGIRITSEVTPHHLLLTSDSVLERGADAKMNPPLGDDRDRNALMDAFREGVIDCIATDHAPHTIEEKSKGLVHAPYGVIGLETAFAVCYSKLVCQSLIPLERLIEALTDKPREIFGLERVGIFRGSRADLTCVDTKAEWIIEPERFYSKGRNCPFAGWKVRGRVNWTMYMGQIIFTLHA